MRALLAATALLALAACSTSSQQSTIAALESALTAADDAALGYLTLPVCPTGAPACGDPAIRVRIKASAKAAFDAVTAAEAAAKGGATVDLTAATAALASYSDLIALTVKAK